MSFLGRARQSARTALESCTVVVVVVVFVPSLAITPSDGGAPPTHCGGPRAAFTLSEVSL